jgi:DNA-binding HxlR family transcriptional regulator
MPAKADLSTLNCSLARALNQVGDWWSLLIVREALLGSRRFSEFQQSLGIARNTLSQRLDDLVAAGILKRAGTEKRPLYTPTDRGVALLPVIVALLQWGDAYLAEEGAPLIFSDERGVPLAPIALHATDGKPVAAERLRARPGPGADERTRAFFESFTPPGTK